MSSAESEGAGAAPRRRRKRKGAAAFVSEEEAPTPTTAEMIRTTPIRVTVDLPPLDHKALKRWCNQTALDLDLTGVALAQALRALAAELSEPDPARRLPGLEDRIKDRLKPGRVAGTESQ
ncbi:hypothetical protein AB0C93_37950 [Streptomyces sp. NPDC048518]|uniref:hypothetical protein n=1 Tax=Streptomyces sp. NPDC048518 TaxID=3155029 RepID=UPI0033E10633